MSLKIDLEREFFKVARDLSKEKQIKKQFLKRVNSLSEDWIENKFRLGILGLKK